MHLVPGGGAVYTHRFAGITVAGLKYAIVVVGGHIPMTLYDRIRATQNGDIHKPPEKGNTYTHNVVDVLTVGGSLRADARTDAVLIRAHEVGPLVELLSGAKDIAVNETTDGVAVAIGAVVVQFASRVTTADVDLGEIALAGDLDILGRLHKVDALDRALWHQAGAVARLRAVGDHLALGVADVLDRGGSPQAEIIDAVEPCIIHQPNAFSGLSERAYRGSGTWR
jgi:hypothetical protein